MLGRHLLHLSGEVGGETGHPEHLLTSLQERLWGTFTELQVLVLVFRDGAHLRNYPES